MKWVAIAIASGALCLGVYLPPESEKRWFVDDTFLYERGSALGREYLQEHAPEFSSRLTELLAWVVRIEVQHSRSESGYSSNHGTGIILSGGRVLTAGHILTEGVADSIAEIVLTLPDGRVFHAEPEKRGSQDWALLRILEGDGHASIADSPVELDSATEGETTVFLGYPARLGLDGLGSVRSFHKGDAKAAVPVSKLSPMLVVSSVLDTEAMTLEPLAGFPPVGGMSGGPILNSEGRVVGVQTSVSKTSDNATGKVCYYRINAVPAGSVQR